MTNELPDASLRFFVSRGTAVVSPALAIGVIKVPVTAKNRLRIDRRIFTLADSLCVVKPLCNGLFRKKRDILEYG
ncbi:MULTISPECIES: hypothetical protein [Pseudomonas]|uniref:hypothetical protein n=1 Tax=Pseudomonas TaxID=286 RepID=UPI001CD7A488|nr:MULTISPECIES: hypothetical protein [Pseudomonas]MDR6926004.1 hypothetical protein [Pseudomonas sp. BE134]MDR7283365.1 hypothetical protein [Pseudomonas corrugata]